MALISYCDVCGNEVVRDIQTNAHWKTVDGDGEYDGKIITMCSECIYEVNEKVLEMCSEKKFETFATSDKFVYYDEADEDTVAEDEDATA